MNAHALIDTIRPDWPAESAVRVVSHFGDMRFVEVTSMTGPDEGWSLQLDIDQAQALAESIRLAAVRAGRPSSPE